MMMTYNRVAAHLLSLCRLAASQGGTRDQINAAMPRLIAVASVLAAQDDLKAATERLQDLQATRH